MAKIVDIEPSINRFREIYAESVQSDYVFAGYNLGVAQYLESLPRMEIRQHTHGNWMRFIGKSSARCSVCGCKEEPGKEHDEPRAETAAVRSWTGYV